MLFFKYELDYDLILKLSLTVNHLHLSNKNIISSQNGLVSIILTYLINWSIILESFINYLTRPIMGEWLNRLIYLNFKIII